MPAAQRLPTSVQFGGRLVVRNLGPEPKLGDAYWLIDAASFSGTFTQLDLPALGTGLAWDIPSLVGTGVLSVRKAMPQTIGGYRYDAEAQTIELEFTGNPGYPYRIQTTTRLTAPIVWETSGTRVADLVTGQFRFTETNVSGSPQRFHRTVFP
jgi:hypothetical protein